MKPIPFVVRWLLLLALLLAGRFAVHAQNVGIGTTSPTQPLDVNGNVRVRALNGSSTRLVQADANGNLTSAAALYPTDGAAAAPLASTTTGLNNPLVALNGTLAVVLNRGANSLSLYDLSNPSAPVLRGTLTDATNLANAQEVAINGTVAAVLCNTANGNGSDIGLTRLFTLSSGTPTLANTLVPAPGALSAVNGAMTILDNRLFAVYDKGGSPGTFYVYDITTPATASQLGTSPTANGSFTPQAAAAAGSFVAVSCMYGGVTIMSVSNPAAPVAVGNTGFPGYNGGFDVPVALSTSTLCSLTISTNTLNTYSLSTAGVPSLRSTFTTAASPVSVALSGSLAYVACRVSGANVLQIVDVSGSTAVLRGTVPLDATANNVATTGTLTAVASGAAANDLQIFSTGRVLTVAPDGSISSAPAPSGTTFIQNQTASTQSGGFRVSGNGYIGGNVGIGTTAPAYPLDVNGSIHAVTSQGVVLDGQDRPLITRGWDAFSSGAYNGLGRWGVFMEPNTLTFGVPAQGGKQFQWVTYNANSTISSTPMTLTQGGNLGIGAPAPTATLEVGGYTKLDGPVAITGATVPAIATALFTGTLPSAANTNTAVALGGIATARILSVSVLAVATGAGAGNFFAPNQATSAGFGTGYEYGYWLETPTGSIRLSTGSNSANMLGGAVKLLVTYMP